MNTQTLPRANEDEHLAPGPITQLRTQLEQRAEEFRMVLPSHITQEKFQRTVLTAAQSNPDLLKCDRRSFLTSCMKAAQDGLLPDGREAAIVPFNTRMKVAGQWQWVKLAQYMPMVFGLRKKILQSDEVTDIYSAVVYKQEIEAGRFVYEEGSERTLRHKPILDFDFRPSDADIALVYSVATFANGFKSFEVMRRYEIDEVRETSQSGAEFDAKGEPRDAKGPWVDWYAEMAKKTCIRRHSKSLPQSSDIIADVEAEDMAFASRSALALLEGTKPDAPMLSPDLGPPSFPDPTVDEGGTFDDETGEERPEPEPEPKPEPEVKRGPGRPRKAETAPEKPEPEAPSHVDASDNDPPEAGLDLPGHEPGAPEPEDYGTDELGISMTGDQVKADEFVSRAKACETIVDFRKLERDAEMSLAEMPVHLANIVDTVFEQTRKRLTPRRKPEDE